MEVTTSGRPPKITREWFRARYGQNFPDLLAEDKNDFLDTAILDVYTLFYGVGELWEHLPRKEYVQKTNLKKNSLQYINLMVDMPIDSLKHWYKNRYEWKDGNIDEFKVIAERELNF